jgi:predicted transcriptional regulator
MRHQLSSISAVKKFSMTSHNTAAATSRVVREALVALADMEDRLDKIEADPAFLEMMRQSDDDIRAGRVVSHEEVKRRLRRKHGEKR